MTVNGRMRADLHVHSYHSGNNHDLPFLRSRDCYAEPEAIYRTAKSRGMDLITITDHDSIDGCLELLDRHPDAPDVIVGEEITSWTPRVAAGDVPIEVHLGAYGMTERAHREIQPLRRNVFEAIAYLREARIFFALNHLFHFYKGQMPLARYLALMDAVPALEARNGAMLPAHNRLIVELIEGRGAIGPCPIARTPIEDGSLEDRTREQSAAARDGGATAAPRHGASPHAMLGGSDAHTLRRVGRTWTTVPARTREEFLANLAAGLGRAEGDEGGTLPLAADIYGVIGQYWLSLVGLRRHELSWGRRAFGLAFSVGSAPFEFIPLLIAALSKRSEARRIRDVEALLRDARGRDTGRAANALHASAPGTLGRQSSAPSAVFADAPAPVAPDSTVTAQG